LTNHSFIVEENGRTSRFDSFSDLQTRRTPPGFGPDEASPRAHLHSSPELPTRVERHQQNECKTRVDNPGDMLFVIWLADSFNKILSH